MVSAKIFAMFCTIDTCFNQGPTPCCSCKTFHTIYQTIFLQVDKRKIRSDPSNWKKNYEINKEKRNRQLWNSILFHNLSYKKYVYLFVESKSSFCSVSFCGCHTSEVFHYGHGGVLCRCKNTLIKESPLCLYFCSSSDSWNNKTRLALAIC